MSSTGDTDGREDEDGAGERAVSATFDPACSKSGCEIPNNDSADDKTRFCKSGSRSLRTLKTVWVAVSRLSFAALRDAITPSS